MSLSTQIPRETKTFDTLIGRTIKKVYVNQDSTVLKFVDIEDKEYFYFAEADCCSESWFENFKEFRYISEKMPRTITDVFSLSCNCEPPGTRQDVDQITHYSLTFESKYFDQTISFNLRNSSNGYYSGWATFVGNEVPVWCNKEEKQVFRFAE